MKKRILAFLSALFLLMTSFPVQVYAAEDEGMIAYETSSLADGNYCVPVSVTNYYGGAAGNTYIGTTDKYRTALLQVQDGQETVTLRIGNWYNMDKTLKVLKEEYYEYFLKQGRFDPTEYYLTVFTEEEYAEEAYWKEIEIKENTDYGYADITFEIDNPEFPVIMGVSARAWSDDGIVVNGITLNRNMAEVLPDLDSLESGVWYFDMRYVIETRYGTSNYALSATPQESAGALSGFKALFEPAVQVTVNQEEKSATAVFTLTESGKENLQKLLQASGTGYMFTSPFQARANYVYPIGRYEGKYPMYQELDFSAGTFTAQFDLADYSALAFGDAFIAKATGHEETHDCATDYRSDKKWFYYFGFIRLKTTEAEAVNLETTINAQVKGETKEITFRFQTTTENIPTDTRLLVEQVQSGEAYETADSTLEGTCRGWSAFHIQLQDNAGNMLDDTLANQGILSVSIPSNYVNGELYYYTKKPGAVDGTLNPIAGTLKDGDCAVNTNTMGYWVYADSYSFNKWGDSLEPGVYSVEAVVYHMIRKQTSMANVALRTPVILYVEEDGTKTLYYEMGSGFAMGMVAYLADMRYYSEYEYLETGYPSGTVSETYVLSYQKTEDGAYLTDGLNYGPLEYYPREMFFELADGNPVIPVQVEVPIMNLMAAGGGTQDCRFCLDYSTATKLEGEFEMPTIRKAIAAAVEVVDSAAAGDYTSETYAALMAAKEAAVQANNNENATDAELSDAYFALRSAISGMELVEEIALGESLYTAQASLGSPEESSHEVSARIRKNENGYRIILEAEGLKGLAYLDQENNQYVNADMTIDPETAVATADFTVTYLKSEFPLLYTYTEGDTTGVSGTLKWTSDFEEQIVDASALEAKIEEATALVKEAEADTQKYDSQKTAALSVTLAEVLVVCKDPMALQTELDAQIEVLKAAMDDLKLGVNLEELESLLASIREELTQSTYTPESWAVLQAQIDAGQAIVSAAAAGQDVDAGEAAGILTLLQAAREGLVERGDKTELQKLYEEAAEIENKGQACYDVLQTVIASTKSVLEDDNAVQSTVDAQYRSLELAVINLYGGMDKGVLADLVAEIEQKLEDGELEGASVESLAFLNAALASAQEVLDNAGASQQDVDKQIPLLESVYYGMVAAEDENTVFTGTYEIGGYMKHASQDTDSMGNAALDKPMRLVVDVDEETGEAKCTLYMDFHSLTIGASSGYLAELSYFPNYDAEYELPENVMPTSVTVEEYYDDLYDYYNDPNTGKDVYWRGKLYPKTMSIPVDLNDDMIWVQVYVPVMEELSAGSGTQYAKLYLYWDELTQISGAATDNEETLAAKETLLTQVESARTLLDEAPDTCTESQIAMLQAAVIYGKAVYDSMNVDAVSVENAAAAIAKAMDVFSEEPVEVDKAALGQAIKAAQDLLNDENIVWEPAAREYLELMLANAVHVYESDQVVVGQVSAWTSALNAASDNLTALFDKTELRKALDAAKTYLDAKEYYSAMDLEILQQLCDAAEAVYENPDVTQDEVNAQVKILNYTVGSLKRIDEVAVDKTGLHELLQAAAGLSGRENLYTQASLQALLKVMSRAEELYHDVTATQAEVNAQSCAVSQAILNLQMKTSTGGSYDDEYNGGSGSGSGTDDEEDDNNGSGSTSLDRYNLADGVYSLTGKMVKIDKKTASMSNEAINHTVKLTVKGGKYYITLDFSGLHYAGQYGYLGWMKYFKTGYSLDRYGNPTGTLGSVTVDSIQKDSSGNAVKDTFGTNYPDQVTFPLIQEAISDGYVPLQVFVPIMESISTGSGTQPVYLKLSWSTLKKTTADDEAFEGEDDNDNVNDTDDEKTGSSLLTFTSTLKSSGTGSLGTSSLNTSSLNSSALKSTSSALKSSSSALKSGTSALNSGVTALDGTALESANYEGFLLPESEEALSGAGSTTVAAASGSVSAQNTTGSSGTGFPVIPFVTSLLAVAAGALYKLKSRGLLFK